MDTTTDEETGKWICSKCGKITHLELKAYNVGFCESCGANLLPQYLKSVGIKPARVFFEDKPEGMKAKAWEKVKKLQGNAKGRASRRVGVSRLA
jgi:uncharacterized protein YqkB